MTVRMMVKWSSAAILAMAAVGVLTFGAAAQNCQFSFAYDQPKGSGYDAGADMFNAKLMELSKGTLSINKISGRPTRHRTSVLRLRGVIAATA